MREAAELAVAVRLFGEVEKREGVRQPALRRDAEIFQERFADEMRRTACHRPEAEIDAGLAEMHGQKLCVRVRHVQHAGIAEAADAVEIIGVGGARQIGWYDAV